MSAERLSAERMTDDDLASIEARHRRMYENDYVQWQAAGGDIECEHGYALPCPTCDRRLNQRDVPALVREVRALRELAKELAALVSGEAICSVCRGTGQAYRHCSDPQHGDSTWDHDCDDDYDSCYACEGGHSPYVNAVLAKARAAGVLA